MLIVATKSTAGAVRSNNEDSTLSNLDAGLIAIADGMGGHNAGEVASRLAVNALASFIESTMDAASTHWPFGLDSGSPLDVNRLRTAMKLANREVFRTAEENEQFAGMGTTLTAALIASDGLMRYSSVGDSRLYLLSGSGSLAQLTRDDSLVGMLADAPGVDLAALEDHPMKHMLTNVLGRKADLDVTVDEATLADGDAILLCTDGLHGAVADAELLAALTEEPDLQHAADRLVQSALDKRSRDNISVLIARDTT
jgi:protein phosphatase